MRKQSMSRAFSLVTALMILAAIAGCNQTLKSTETPATQPPITEPTETAVVESTATKAAPEQVVDPNILYHDDFKNPATGWAEEKFDNYFIGYHEPEYYHVEITSPNYKTQVFEPNKQSFADATIEAKAFTVAKKTAATGDFNYGIAFRRSGDQYYAFTISPRTKKWYVLKSSSTALTVLAEGTEASIHDLDADRKSTRLNSSHIQKSRMPSSA